MSIVRSQMFMRRRISLVLFPGQWWPPGVDTHHADAARGRTNQAAQVTAHASVVDDLDVGARVLGARANRLMRAIVASDVAKTAADTLLLIDAGDDLVVEVELFPTRHGRQRAPDDVVDRAEALCVEIVVQPIDHVLDD